MACFRAIRFKVKILVGFLLSDQFREGQVEVLQTFLVYVLQPGNGLSLADLDRCFFVACFGRTMICLSEFFADAVGRNAGFFENKQCFGKLGFFM